MTDDPFRRLAPVVRLAPAKLNLTLAVLGKRRDGFHDLHSVAVPLGLADRLSVAPAAGAEDTLRVDGHDAGPTEDNLVLRAVSAARRAVGRGAATVPLAIRLEKRIPVAAGLGGGSSDAAAALDAALEAWQVPPDLVDRAAIAATLGSDVPFFLAGGSALLGGRGERATLLPDLTGQPLGVLLVTPPTALSTAVVFAAFDAAATAGSDSTRLTSEHLASELRAGLSGRALLDRAGILAVANDLSAPANVLAPALLPLRRALTRLLHRSIGQTGSGPTLWALYPSLEEAEAAAAELHDAVETKRLPAIGESGPSIAATTILRREADHEEGSAR
ncbi:MAG TPA: 4-(cytidine 5'-diphospho)-2-C-methyl-D-erythritol kinase [Candidatus Polarisedimenticolia bacterium]|nr:4-(cytidine 5'-diphospho)-2-C-methyl-D-erythritol kinase [Candidatus Polarisedimenticolia bacterium]